MPTGQNIDNSQNLADQSYWDSSYANHKFEMAPSVDPVRQWIEKNIPASQGKSCFEIGCFPGRYLSVFGKLGYELHGVDLTPRVTKDFPEWLKASGFKTGEFQQADIFKFSTEKKYDLVCSFGFIEHFPNWDEVLKIHAELVAPGGLLVVETPNFRGAIQKFIHTSLDKENYLRHYIPSMDPFKWKKVLEGMGFEISYCSYMGRFEYWTDVPPKGFFQKSISRVTSVIGNRILKRLPADKKIYSPYIGIIAKKKG